MCVVQQCRYICFMGCFCLIWGIRNGISASYWCIRWIRIPLYSRPLSGPYHMTADTVIFTSSTAQAFSSKHPQLFSRRNYYCYYGTYTCRQHISAECIVHISSADSGRQNTVICTFHGLMTVMKDPNKTIMKWKCIQVEIYKMLLFW